MKSYPNWTSNATNTIWKHKANPKVMVAILKNTTHPNMGKYLIFHSHPGPNGTAIVQDPEGARSMEAAREKAERHLEHWGPEEYWKSDPGYGRMGKRGT